MAAEFGQVNDEVLEIAREMIEKHHPNLANARIAFIFRDEAPLKDGRAVLGKAALVSAKWKPLLKDTYDFLIWLAADRWFLPLEPHQKRALIDHELCHCRIVDGNPKMRGHDIEEFCEIVERHGDWLGQVAPMKAAWDGKQLPLVPFEANVSSPDIGGKPLFDEEAKAGIKEAMESEFPDTTVEWVKAS